MYLVTPSCDAHLLRTDRTESGAKTMTVEERVAGLEFAVERLIDLVVALDRLVVEHRGDVGDQGLHDFGQSLHSPLEQINPGLN